MHPVSWSNASFREVLSFQDRLTSRGHHHCAIEIMGHRIGTGIIVVGKMGRSHHDVVKLLLHLTVCSNVDASQSTNRSLNHASLKVERSLTHLSYLPLLVCSKTQSQSAGGLATW
ncbi:MAG: hypothetical protein H6Q41_3363 [Deltaproteobacteria bacterium]|nr:hypothetical protein [Deltaproteobacteria bacterium]